MSRRLDTTPSRPRGSNRLLLRFVLVAALAGVGVAVVGAALLGVQARGEALAEAASRNSAAAASRAERMDARVREAGSSLAVMAASPTVTAMGHQAPSELNVGLRVLEVFDELHLLDARGQPLAAAASRFEADVSAIAARPDLVAGVANGLSARIVPDFPPRLEVAVAVEDPPGTPVGVLVGYSPLDVAFGFLLERRPGWPYTLLLTGPDGRILVHPDRDRVARAESFSPETVSMAREGLAAFERDGEAMLLSAVPMGEIDGFLAVEQREASALTSVGQRMLELVGILLLAIFMVVVAVSAAGGYMLRPLTTLTRAVDRLAAGEEGVRIGAHRKDELGVLTKSFDRMADDLDRRAAELEELRRLSLLVNGSADRPGLSSDIVEGARNLLNAEAAALWTVGERGEVYVDAVDGFRVTGPLEALVRSVIRDRQAVQRRLGGVDVLATPVPTLDGAMMGVLVVCGAPDGLSEADGEIAAAFAAFAGVALQNVRRLELERGLVLELQETVDRRQDLISSVTHEFRTPLTCIEGFSRALLDDWREFDDEQRRLFIAKIHQHSVNLDGLVTRLLDFSMAERGSLDAQVIEVALRPVLEAALSGLEPVLRGRPLTVDVPEVRVRADEALLLRTVTNLVTNAVRYSAEGAPVRLGAAVEDNRVRVWVADKGVGLTVDELPHVFQPFWRASAPAAQRVRGTGLGLTLVAEYVRLMDGEFGVESVPGEGSTFWFTLAPVGARPPAEIAGSDAPSA